MHADRRRLFSPLILCLTLALTVIPCGIAQSTKAELYGIVRDPSGAVVPAVSVALSSITTGIVLAGTTGTDGSYQFGALSPGMYRLDVAKQGFAPLKRGRYSSFIAASGLGNEPRVLITLRSDMFSDSTTLVV